MKKVMAVIITTGLALGIFWYFYNRHQEYTVEYYINDYKIIESFDMNIDSYHLKIQENGNIYEFYPTINYSPKRKIITSIESFDEKNLKCIRVNDNVLDYPLCKQNQDYVSYYSDVIKTDNLKDTYNNVEIYNLLNKTFLIWNYKGFYYLKEDKITTINLFESDTYNPYLLNQIKDQLFIVDYDSKYEFDKYYLVDFKKATSKEYKLDRKISSQSNILGQYKNSIYLVDPKAEQEYEINIKKGKVYKTSPKLLVNEEWQKTTIESLLNQNQTFKSNALYSFILDNKKLYYVQGDIKTKVSNLNVDSIVNYTKDSVYYIANGTVYYFKINEGATRVMKYSEWNFNYTNCVFVYDNQKN